MSKLQLDVEFCPSCRFLYVTYDTHDYKLKRIIIPLDIDGRVCQRCQEIIANGDEMK